MENKKIKLMKPENLNLEERIKDDLPYFIPIRKDAGYYSWEIRKGKTVRKYIPAMYYLVNVLIERMYVDKNPKRNMYSPEYLKMYSRDIEPIKSKNYFKMIWSMLKMLKVLHFTHMTEPTPYKKSAQGYYFKFTDAYVDQKIVEHEIEVKPNIYKKFIDRSMFKKKDQEFLDLEDEIKSNHVLHQFRMIKEMNFQHTQADNYVERLLTEKRITVDHYNTCKTWIKKIQQKEHVFTVSKKCDRLYTTVNLIPKTIRPFVKDSTDQSLIELDYGSYNAFAVYKILNSTIPEFENNADKIAFENEVDLYRRLLSGGNFYMDIKDIVFPEQNLTREEIKKIVLHRWFNGKVNSRNKHRKVLKSRFPKITKAVDEMKMEEYSDFANFVMTMENKLVFETIYKKFIQKEPEAVIFPIFDGFFVEASKATILHGLMVEEGNKYFNLNCIVKANPVSNELLMT